MSNSAGVSEAFFEVTPSNRWWLDFRAARFDPNFLAKKIEQLIGDDVVGGKLAEVADLGCNIGAKTKLLAEIVKALGAEKVHVDAIDRSESAIEFARHYYADPDVRYCVGDILGSDLGAQKYDFVFLCAVCHYFENDEQRILALRKMSDALKTGGVGVVFNVFLTDNPVVDAFISPLLATYMHVERGLISGFSNPNVSDIRRLVTGRFQDVLEYRGDFVTSGIPALANTRMVVLQRE